VKLLPVLIVGLVLGLAGGLVYTWVIAPVEYINTYPSFLSTAYRKDWIRMSALAYGVEGNLDRTYLRLRGLSEEEIRYVLLETLEEAVVSDFDIEALRPLAKLAADYGVDSPTVRVYTAQNIVLPEKPSATRTPTPTAKPLTATPTLTPSPTPAFLAADSLSPLGPSAFTVISHTLICSEIPTIAVSLELTSTLGVEYAPDVSRTLSFTPTSGLTPTQDITSTMELSSTLDITTTLDLSRTLELTSTLELVVENEKPPIHNQNWGREIWLMWDDGADRAFTGFRPEYGLGYADFTVEPGRTYNLYIDNPWGVPIMVLQVEPCTAEEGGGWISRKLVVVEGLE
jgi:hypothetical protein